MFDIHTTSSYFIFLNCQEIIDSSVGDILSPVALSCKKCDCNPIFPCQKCDCVKYPDINDTQIYLRIIHDTQN